MSPERASALLKMAMPSLEYARRRSAEAILLRPTSETVRVLVAIRAAAADALRILDADLVESSTSSSNPPPADVKVSQ
jgi:hypothetical protein